MIEPTRRTMIFGAGLAGLGGLSLGARPVCADPPELVRAARAEGGVTWHIAQLNTETAEQMGAAFTARYPGIQVSVIRTTGQVAYKRPLRDLRNGTRQCDVFSSTGIAQHPAPKKRGALAEFRPEAAAGSTQAALATADSGFYDPSAMIAHIVIYNSAKVEAADAPDSWTDLLDPKWNNRIATGQFAFSGCTGIWVVALRTQYS